jgi:hypothetical protein
MSERQIQERCEFPNGIKTEWEPTDSTVTESKAKQVIARMNREAKMIGSYQRYRSVSTGD